jgi:hypothetical protein
VWIIRVIQRALGCDTATAGLSSVIRALDVVEPRTGARSGVGDTAAFGAGPTAGCLGVRVRQKSFLNPWNLPHGR